MKARPAVVCPSCGALNRTTWEFCARCNESLEGAQPAAAPAAGEAAEGRPSAVAPRLILLATALALVALGAAAWRYAANAPPRAAADPSLFTIPTRPPQPPPAPVPTGAGASDFDAARRLLAKGDVAGALARLAAAVSASPGNAAYHDLYADVLWRAGQREEALAEHAEAARLEPRLRLRYARALDMLGRRAEAQREYEAIVAANPDAGLARGELGRVLYQAGDYAKAVPYLQQAVKDRPGDLVLQQEYGYALERAGQREQAAAVYREILRRAPSAVVTRTLLSESLVEAGRRDEAAALLREGLKSSPDTPLLHRQLGGVLERSGRPAEAAAEYRTYARLAPNAPDARELTGRAARLEAAGSQP
jgi:tetratricopeptide (TPR) repeat protein